jgi:hypothetical protein
VAVGLAIACAFALLSREELYREFSRGPAAAIIVTAVFLTTMLAFVLYVFATNDELEMAREYRYVESIGSLKWVHLALIFVLALCFGGLIAFITKPVIYMGIVVVLQAADCIGAGLVYRSVLVAYEDLNVRGSKEVGLKLPDAIHDYYLLKPHYIQRTARLLGYFTALLLALIGKYQAEPILTQLAWVIVVATTIACEFVIHRWRKERQQRLGLEKG